MARLFGRRRHPVSRPGTVSAAAPAPPAAPAAPERAHDQWQGLPPLRPAVSRDPSIAPSGVFQRALASRHVPATALRALSHDVIGDGLTTSSATITATRLHLERGALQPVLVSSAPVATARALPPAVHRRAADGRTADAALETEGPPSWWTPPVTEPAHPLAVVDAVSPLPRPAVGSGAPPPRTLRAPVVPAAPPVAVPPPTIEAEPAAHAPATAVRSDGGTTHSTGSWAPVAPGAPTPDTTLLDAFILAKRAAAPTGPGLAATRTGTAPAPPRPTPPVVQRDASVHPAGRITEVPPAQVAAQADARVAPGNHAAEVPVDAVAASPASGPVLDGLSPDAAGTAPPPVVPGAAVAAAPVLVVVDAGTAPAVVPAAGPTAPGATAPLVGRARIGEPLTELPERLRRPGTAPTAPVPDLPPVRPTAQRRAAAALAARAAEAEPRSAGSALTVAPPTVATGAPGVMPVLTEHAEQTEPAGRSGRHSLPFDVPTRGLASTPPLVPPVTSMSTAPRPSAAAPPSPALAPLPLAPPTRPVGSSSTAPAGTHPTAGLLTSEVLAAPALLADTAVTTSAPPAAVAPLAAGTGPVSPVRVTETTAPRAVQQLPDVPLLSFRAPLLERAGVAALGASRSTRAAVGAVGPAGSPTMPVLRVAAPGQAPLAGRLSSAEASAAAHDRAPVRRLPIAAPPLRQTAGPARPAAAPAPAGPGSQATPAATTAPVPDGAPGPDTTLLDAYIARQRDEVSAAPNRAATVLALPRREPATTPGTEGPRDDALTVPDWARHLVAPSTPAGVQRSSVRAPEAPATAPYRPPVRGVQREVQVLRGPAVDSRAAQLGARAWTENGQVHLPSSAGSLDSGVARELLAHEAVHVAQQAGGETHHEHSSAGSALEEQARTAERAMRSPGVGQADAAPAPPPAVTAQRVRLDDPLVAAVTSGLGQLQGDGSVSFGPPPGPPSTAAARSVGGSAVQRSVVEAPPVQRAEASSPPAETPGGGSPDASHGGSQGGDDASTTAMADKVYERVRQRLRQDLVQDRERIGSSLDR